MSVESWMQKSAYVYIVNGLLEAKAVGLGAALYSIPAGQDYVDTNNIGGYQRNPSDGKWYGSPPAPDYGWNEWGNPAPPDLQQKLSDAKKRIDDTIRDENILPNDKGFFDNLRDIYSQLNSADKVNEVIDHLGGVAKNQIFDPLFNSPSPTDPNGWLLSRLRKISDRLNDLFGFAKRWTQPRDPLAGC